MPQLTSLAQLNDYCCFTCGVSDDPHQSQIVAAAVKHATRYCGARRPHGDNERHCERMLRKVGRAAHDELVGFGILTFVVGEVVSFLIGKALECFWSWYWGEPHAPQLCAAMAAPLPAWHDDGDE